MMMPSFLGSIRRRDAMAGLLSVAAVLVAPVVSADAAPRAEVTVIHATKCEKKKVDPKIGDPPPSLGYDCLELVKKEALPLALGKPATMALPNGRTFQLLYSAKDGPRFKVAASISPQGGGAGFTKLADITAEPNKPFNVGGFAHDKGVLLLSVKVVP